MELPKRKQNRLTDYDYSTPNAYFITICTENRKCLLSTIVGAIIDRPAYSRLTAAGEKVEEAIRGIPVHYPNVHLEKYVIMPNHIHLILLVAEPADAGTSWAPSPTNAVIPHFVSTLKRFCHRDIGRKLFQRSYHDHVIRDRQDYQKIWTYIDNNPAKWELDCFYTD